MTLLTTPSNTPSTTPSSTRSSLSKWLAAACATVALTLGGCATPPSAASLASLPVVTYPQKPSGKGDYVYKLPAGQPIDVRVLAQGSALQQDSDRTVQATLKRDLYLHRQWVSEDGQHWVDRKELLDVQLRITLPSYEVPGPGEIKLSIDRKAPR